MTRLNERVFERVEQVGDTRRRAKVFAFPQQMATRARRADDLGGGYLRHPPFDWPGPASRRLLHERHPGGHAYRPAARQHRPEVRGGRSEPSWGPGKAYFVERLLRT